MQFIISDIHGCFYTLQKMIERVRITDVDADFVFIGDYFDRGPYSRQVVELLAEMKKEGAICLRGNHDEVIDWILNKHSESPLTEVYSDISDMGIAMWWCWNGFQDALISYGVECSELEFQRWVDEFREKVPQHHKDFVKGLPVYWENETHFACHAYFPPEEKKIPPILHEGLKYIMLWERFPRSGQLQTRETQWEKIGVFGHTPVSYYGAVAPIRYGNIRLIDTCAFQGEYMCAYCCELDEFILQATDERDLGKNEQV